MQAGVRQHIYNVNNETFRTVVFKVYNLISIVAFLSFGSGICLAKDVAKIKAIQIPL